MKMNKNKLKTNPVALLCDLVRIPSISGSEEKIVSYVINHADDRGFRVERAGRNVLIRLGIYNGRRLLLNSHLDTVLAQDTWKTDPFEPVVSDGRITGLGANDAKGCVTAMLCAAEAVNAQRLNGELVLALTVEEETAKTGAGLEWLINRLGTIDAAVIGEPTGLDICRAQKGLLILEVQTSGTARHAAHAHNIRGKNAVIEAARSILAIEDRIPGYDHELLGSVTCQVTTIQGGKSKNVIPDSCRFTLDIRTVHGAETEDIVSFVTERTGAGVSILSDRMKPMDTDENSGIVQAAVKSRPGADIIGSATMSDAVWTRHVPTIKVGPGQTERSHTANEYISVNELNEGVDFYTKLIREFLG